MAQKVRYSENNVVFTEGPFVVSCIRPETPLERYRIEAEMKGGQHPFLPDHSIYPLGKMLGLGDFTTTNDRALAERVCDKLNQMVRNGQIILDPKFGKAWILNPLWGAIVSAAAVAV